MLTLISGTDRANGNTRKLAHYCETLLQQKKLEYRFLDLSDDIPWSNPAQLNELIETHLHSAKKMWILLPEYNGSYPGILKLLVDRSEVKKAWRHKKMALVGVSTGRAGNLRGLDHFTGSLMHMQAFVHPNRLPISKIDTLLDQNGMLIDPSTAGLLESQLNDLIQF
ncbi:MAG: NADPH-dependent FMN reductase [Ferruginibacter sp.]